MMKTFEALLSRDTSRARGVQTVFDCRRVDEALSEENIPESWTLARWCTERASDLIVDEHKLHRSGRRRSGIGERSICSAVTAWSRRAFARRLEHSHQAQSGVPRERRSAHSRVTHLTRRRRSQHPGRCGRARGLSQEIDSTSCEETLEDALADSALYRGVPATRNLARGFERLRRSER